MKMTKAITLVLMLTLAVCTFALQAGATAESVSVTVTIANGTPVLSAQTVEVTDTDADGILTINDALYCAHETAYEGGAAAGYASAQSEYGMSMSKLWGIENGSSFGYYVNNASAMSLVDPVANGDYICAFVYTDLTAWSDTYSYFDVTSVTADSGKTVTLTLSAAGFDENWAPVTLPVEGATITVDGTATELVTDAEGKVTLSLADGSHVISATSSTLVLVPPVCLATIGSTEAADAPVSAIPMYVWYAAGAVVISAIAAVCIMLARNKKNA